MVKKKKKGKGKGCLAGLVAALLVLSPLMSHAAATGTLEHRFVAGDRRIAVGSWNPGVYATGGVAVTAQSLGLTEIQQVIVEGAGGVFYQYDKANGKIKAYRSAGFTPSGTNANEAAHTHPVALDSGLSSSDSAGTPAGTNAASTVEPYHNGDPDMAVKPVIALTHNADCAAGLNANPLFILEEGLSSQLMGTLESNCNGAASVLGETANGSVGGVGASARFWVEHDATPEGVQIYVDEANGDRLEAVLPSATDAFVMMPFETAGAAPAGYGVTVKVYHDATAATGKPLSFDDNGAADAQLCFTDAGAAGGVIPAGDIAVVVPSYIGNGDARGGVAAAQVFTGAALAGHTHGPGTLADAASGAGSAHTHVFTGDAVAAAAAVEVANAVNLSAGSFTGRYIAIGR